MSGNVNQDIRSRPVIIKKGISVPNMRLKTKTSDEALIIYPGRMIESIEVFEVFKQAIEEAYESKNLINVVITMEETEYIDSMAIGALIGIKKRINERKGLLVICDLNKELDSLFETLGMGKVLKITPTLQDAVSIASSNTA
jgi:anti-anti-sigma factor